METQKLKPAKLFIWDLDNVIYPYDDAFHQACDEAAWRAASALGVRVPASEAHQLGRKSCADYGGSADVYIREHGVPEHAMHQRYHEEVSLDFLTPDHRLNFGFTESCGGGVTHAILTHGSTDWARRVLRARQLDRYFNPEHIVGIEQIEFQKKHHSRAPFTHLLGLTGHSPGESIMIEDTAANLKHPKVMGMQTVFISYGKGDGDGHADHVFDTAQDFLQAYCKQIPSLPKKRQP